MPLAKFFDETVDACYFVHPNKFFGKHIFIVQNSCFFIHCYIFIISNNRICFVFITSIDDESAANAEMKKKRCILPKVYCEKKQKRAQKINATAKQEVVSLPELENEEKAEVRRIIQAKISKMDNMIIELTDEEVINIQDALDESVDEENIDDVCDLMEIIEHGNGYDNNSNVTLSTEIQSPTLNLWVDNDLTYEYGTGDPDILSIFPNEPPYPMPMTSKLEAIEGEVNVHTPFNGLEYSLEQQAFHANVDSTYAEDIVKTHESIPSTSKPPIPEYFRILNPKLYKRLAKAIGSQNIVDLNENSGNEENTGYAYTGNNGEDSAYDENDDNTCAVLEKIIPEIHFHFPGNYIMVIFL